MKTSDLIGPALDWAVAKCQGLQVTKWMHGLYINDADPYAPSTDWSKGGPIIAREKLQVWVCPETGHWLSDCLVAHAVKVYQGRGPTPLIAAMRCYVASKLGDTVDVPEELQ
jgi:hypothetical protein